MRSLTPGKLAAVIGVFVELSEFQAIEAMPYEVVAKALMCLPPKTVGFLLWSLDEYTSGRIVRELPSDVIDFYAGLLVPADATKLVTLAMIAEGDDMEISFSPLIPV